jgi:predicted TIM-barrel fold metal-dependent hydrolase
MKQGYRVIDTDLHVMEPRSLWSERIPSAYRSQIAVTYPGLGQQEITGIQMRVGDVAWSLGFPFLQRQMTRRFEEDPHIGLMHADGGATPENTLLGMGIEGVDLALVVPSVLFALTTADGLDAELVAVACRTYNDWAAEFCGAAPDRFRFWAWLPRQDATLAVEEARRCVDDLGAVGVAITTGNVDGRLLSEPFFDPLWSAIEVLDVPLGLHLYGMAPRLSGDPVMRYMHHSRSEIVAAVLQGSNQAMSAVAELCVGGVLERHPNLRPMIMEVASTWLIWLLQRMDDQWELFAPGIDDVTLQLPPSAYFQRQCSIAVEPDEQHLPYLAEACGCADNLVFTTDYPHHDSAFPHAVDSLLGLGLGEGLTRKILSENTERVFHWAPALR